MRDRLFTCALVASIAAHIILVGLVGKTSAARPITVDDLRVVRVDLVKEPGRISVKTEKTEKTEAPKPEPKPDVPHVPPVNQLVSRDQLPKELRHVNPTKWPKVTGPTKTGSTHTGPAGNPGGELAGIGSANGEDLGQTPSGDTGTGWVPSPNGGSGVGSGTGTGVGTPDPDPGAVEGPASVPSPPPPPPPEPKYVTITVCSKSGLVPGPNCDHKDQKRFADGSEPRNACQVCKAPDSFRSTKADRAEPELIKDSQVDTSSVDESGDYRVTISYKVDTDGNVVDVSVTNSSGIRALDRAVCRAAAKLRYRPAVQNGVPRVVNKTRTYKISL